MGQVPNTSTFSLQDVTLAIYGDTAAGRNLSQCFTDATGTFDSRYQPNSYGSKNNMLNFRNYQHTITKKHNTINTDIFSYSVTQVRIRVYATYNVTSELTIMIHIYVNGSKVDEHSITLTDGSIETYEIIDIVNYPSDTLNAVVVGVTPSEDSTYYYN